MGRQIQFKVALSQDEKSKLVTMSRDNKLSARISKRVLILLALSNKDESGLNYRQVASALNTTAATVAKTAKDYAVSYHFNPASRRRPKVNGELEACVIQLACGKAPEGYADWTLELLTREVNKKEVAEPVCKETIRLMLKKTSSSLGKMNIGASRQKKTQLL